MTMNGAVLPVLAFYIVAAEEQGVKLAALRHDPERHPQGIHGAEHLHLSARPSMRIIADIFSFTSQKMPKFNSISISGYHMQEAGATADLEMAYTLADGLEYVRTGMARRASTSTRLRRGSRSSGRRAKTSSWRSPRCAPAALLWAKLVKQFNPKNPKSMALRTHSQTSGWSLTEQDPFNNVARTCIEAMAARWATRSRCTPTRSTRPSRCRPISRPASRATRSSSSRRKPASAR
jgi:methylmalonyl-CoA mutase